MQILTSDSAPRVDSSGYRRYRLQEFGRILKAPRRVLFQQHLKESNHRLWNTFEWVER